MIHLEGEGEAGTSESGRLRCRAVVVHFDDQASCKGREKGAQSEASAAPGGTQLTFVVPHPRFVQHVQQVGGKLLLAYCFQEALHWAVVVEVAVLPERSAPRLLLPSSFLTCCSKRKCVGYRWSTSEGGSFRWRLRTWRVNRVTL